MSVSLPFLCIKPHFRDLGGFSVKRLLPSIASKMIGPFIFFDHMGPATFSVGQGIDVRPHPHIGLATVTYLFEGMIEHRDSLGTIQTIHAGDVNWMTAGHGIAHSERTPQALRRTQSTVHGIQTWVALPTQHENIAPAFEHHPAATLPTITMPGIRLRLIAGKAFGQSAPTTTFSELFYLACEMEPQATLFLPSDYPQRAVYAVDNAISINGTQLAAGHMALLPPGQMMKIETAKAARLMLLGGVPVDGNRFIWWNFVSSSKLSIEQAKERWRLQQFGKIPGEMDWIPLPEEVKSAESFS